MTCPPLRALSRVSLSCPRSRMRVRRRRKSTGPCGDLCGKCGVWRGRHGGNTCGIFQRGASTHDFQRRRVVRTDGSGEFKEKKKLANFSGQEGLNVAIGGLHSEGINKRRLLNDGSCGHIYTMRKEATKDKYGGFLLGFESDAYKKTNQLGHNTASETGSSHPASEDSVWMRSVTNTAGASATSETTPRADHRRMLQLERYMRRAMSEARYDTRHAHSGRKTNEHAGIERLLFMIDLQTAELESRHPERYAGDESSFQ